MRLTAAILFLALLATSCGTKQEPPIAIDTATSSITQQFEGRFAERFTKLGKVTYDGDKTCYHAEVFYKDDGQEKRYVMPLNKLLDSESQMTIYLGEFPLRLVGEGSPHGENYFQVRIDELMNRLE